MASLGDILKKIFGEPEKKHVCTCPLPGCKKQTVIEDE
jgi:hypothetical protein